MSLRSIPTPLGSRIKLRDLSLDECEGSFKRALDIPRGAIRNGHSYVTEPGVAVAWLDCPEQVQVRRFRVDEADKASVFVLEVIHLDVAHRPTRGELFIERVLSREQQLN